MQCKTRTRSSGQPSYIHEKSINIHISTSTRNLPEEDILLAHILIARREGGPGGVADAMAVAEHAVHVLAPVGDDGGHDHRQGLDEAQDGLLVHRRVRADAPVSVAREWEWREGILSV